MMATRNNSIVSTIDASPVYHDFEPYCEWKRGEDLLILHLPEFKKDHLRVQVNTSGVLKISGERPLEENLPTKRSRFYKETRVPEGCNINDIYGKLSDGKLTIIMPRKSLSIIPPSSSSSSELLVPNKPSIKTIDKTKTRSSLLDAMKEDDMVGFGRFKEDDTVGFGRFKEDNMIGFGGFKVAKKIAMNVGIAVVAIAAFGALLFLKPETHASSSSAAVAKRDE